MPRRCIGNNFVFVAVVAFLDLVSDERFKVFGIVTRGLLPHQAWDETPWQGTKRPRCLFPRVSSSEFSSHARWYTPCLSNA